MNDQAVGFISRAFHGQPRQPLAAGRRARLGIRGKVGLGRAVRCLAVKHRVPDVEIGRERLFRVGLTRREEHALGIRRPGQFLPAAHRLGRGVAGQSTHRTIESDHIPRNLAIRAQHGSKRAAIITGGLPAIPVPDKAGAVLEVPPGPGSRLAGIAAGVAAQRRAVARDVPPDEDACAIGRKLETRDVGLEIAGLDRRGTRGGQVKKPDLILAAFVGDEIEPRAIRAEGRAVLACIAEVGDSFRSPALHRDAPQAGRALVAGRIGIGLLKDHPLAIRRSGWRANPLQGDQVFRGHGARGAFGQGGNSGEGERERGQRDCWFDHANGISRSCGAALGRIVKPACRRCARFLLRPSFRPAAAGSFPAIRPARDGAARGSGPPARFRPNGRSAVPPGVRP